MFRRVNNLTNEEELYYEICDKDYRMTLSNLKKLGISDSEIVKFPILKSYTENISSPKNEITSIPTGITKLDKFIDGGFKPGLYIFGANPGIGKTSLMLHIIENLAMDKHHSLFFNLEMSSFQVMTKLLSNFSYRRSLEDETYERMTINQLSSKSLYNDNEKKYDDKLRKICTEFKTEIEPYINIVSFSEENNYRYVEVIDTALKNYTELYGFVPVVIVDFLQLLQLQPTYDDNNVISNTKEEKRLEVNEIIEKLKKYSNRYNASIILISSLSRSGYTKTTGSDDDFEYSLSIFKESGHIEYTADFLALLTRGENEVVFGEGELDIININVLKNRYGKSSEKIKLGFISEYSYFKEYQK